MIEPRDLVVLVDNFGRDLFNPDGTLSAIDKVEAHRRGLLHRATSVFIFNDRDKLLIQRRAENKYHSPNLWSNTCCTHPFPQEIPLVTAQRRLAEEMGLFVRLTEAFTFSYKVDVGSNLIENEFDHVFFGFSNRDPVPDPAEVSGWAWVTLENLEQELINNSDDYTPWLKICFSEVVMARCSPRMR